MIIIEGLRPPGKVVLGIIKAEFNLNIHRMRKNKIETSGSWKSRFSRLNNESLSVPGLSDGCIFEFKRNYSIISFAGDQP